MIKKRATIIALCMAIVFLLGCATTKPTRYKPPRVASKRALEYPLSAQLDKIEGEVLVGVFVNAEGQPDEVNLIESSGFGVLDSAAYRFAQTLSFDPAVVDGKKVSAWTKLVLRYKLTEVPFEKNKWLDDVRYYQQQIEIAKDSSDVLTFKRKLYTRYIGLSTYVERYDDVEINKTITKVITDEARKRWTDFFDVIAAPFVPYDDFLYRYPKSPLTQNVKEDLIRLLMDAEARIRIQILQQQSNPKLVGLLDIIEQRLDELQTDMYQGLPIESPH